ncbi:hypothetical protein QVD17_31381 [Tagetes erecta]|uniref:Protein kinase domain-containing protein n=1 Tax=Tagetes erecta TaxID=13708 RepID=A0AAD8K5G9_TARER|nr:hypothetical protein QVD17_31381 [Tagetes erecta]
MRPKISDFGLARMFNEDESETNTKRVVGTLHGVFSKMASLSIYLINVYIMCHVLLLIKRCDQYIYMLAYCVCNAV